jgi:Zn-dependent peptidase ImmA (M78 family)
MTGPRIKAKINPDLLVWARETAGISLDDAARRVASSVDQLKNWETGSEQPSIPQLRNLAEVYKRPLAVLYLRERPVSFLPMQDFRRPSVGTKPEFSAALTLEIRMAHQKRNLALELFEEAGEQPPAFNLASNTSEDPDVVAQRLRARLDVEYNFQAKWRDPRVAYNAWLARIEATGALVFQSSKVSSEEASGFAQWYNDLPFIVVNGKDQHARRMYSLLHELVHLTLRQSGVSDLSQDDQSNAAHSKIEAFCNFVAGAVLVPREHLLRHEVVFARGRGSHDWSDAEVKEIATTFSVSREVIVRRLLILGRTSAPYYARKRAQYAQEYRDSVERAKLSNLGKSIPRNMPRETISALGRTLVRKVIENYYQDRMTLSDVSGTLGVKVRHISAIAHQVGFG